MSDNEFEGYEGITEEQKEQLRKIRKEQKLTVSIDSSPEVQRKDKEIKELQKYKEFFEKNAEIVVKKAKELGIEVQKPETVQDLDALARAIIDGSEKQQATGFTPLSGQYGSSEYSNDLPLNERSYDSYESMCEDLKKEAEKSGERGKEANKILNQLLAKEINKIVRHGDDMEFRGSLTDLQKQPNPQLSPEEQDEVAEQLKQNKRKWRRPR